MLPHHVTALSCPVYCTAQDYEAAANYIGTFFELEGKMAAAAAQLQGRISFADDGQQDAQRQASDIRL